MAARYHDAIAEKLEQGLSSIVGEAILDYLKHGRPQTKHRHVFLRSIAPVVPISHAAISSRAGHYLRKAGVQVPRPGSHTLRHTCVQRLVEADFTLKTIGDYVGHRSPSSTQIYSKVAIEALRQVAIGDGEEILMTSPVMHLQSALADPISRFVAHKRALGRGYDTEARALRLFDKYLAGQNVQCLEQVTPDLIEAFLASRPRERPRSYNHLLCTLRRLFEWLVQQSELERSPVQIGPRRVTAHGFPFIFDPPTARRLLILARELPDNSRAPMRGATYHALFAILYGLGLRVGEACRLQLGDVDLDRQLLVIRQTKFYKSRLVPFGPRMAALVGECRQARTRRTASEGAA